MHDHQVVSFAPATIAGWFARYWNAKDHTEHFYPVIGFLTLDYYDSDSGTERCVEPAVVAFDGDIQTVYNAAVSDAQFSWLVYAPGVGGEPTIVPHPDPAMGCWVAREALLELRRVYTAAKQARA